MNEAVDPFRAARLVLTLRQAGVTDPRVLTAIEKTPREPFVPRPFLESAYDDVELPIDCGQSLSRPVIVGAMLQALNLDEHMTVLEIGAGSGYQAAVLAALASRVFTLDRFRTLAEKARAALDEMGLSRVETRHADGLHGWSEASPFDRIILTGSVAAVPGALFAQMKPDGVLVAPVQDGEDQSILQYKLESDGEWMGRKIGKSALLPLEPGLARQL
ncbi:MAG: protein-L-isoaspartate(D-aspartate) O-methyltransferase [Pseudomonadota bacterium]